MNPNVFIEKMSSMVLYSGQIAHIERIPMRVPVYGELDVPLPLVLSNRLQALGMTRLYAHQAETVIFARSGKNVMIATPSAPSNPDVMATGLRPNRSDR